MGDQAKIAFAIDRARAYLLVAAALGERGGMRSPGDGSKDWRGSFERGIAAGHQYGKEAIEMAARIPTVWTGTASRDLLDALQVIAVFCNDPPSALRPIPPERVEAVVAAAEIVGAKLRAAIDSLPSPE